MDREAFFSAVYRNDIYYGGEAKYALRFALDLLNAEKLHLEATKPSSYSSISRLEAAHSELSSMERYIDEYYMD